MASFYWYERNPMLLEEEKAAMAQFFPHFKLQSLPDGRLYWVGNVNPRGSAGGTWTLMAIYDHDHPNNNAAFGSSVRVYSVKPDLNELYRAAGSLPHVLQDGRGDLYLCTARQQDVDSGRAENGRDGYDVTSAAKSLGWAVKWIYLVESWLEGEISDEVFDHGAY